MDVSENSGTPKSSILIGFSIKNHPFWGTVPLFLETSIWISWYPPVVPNLAKSTFPIGNTSSNGGFPLAMLVYRGVSFPVAQAIEIYFNSELYDVVWLYIRGWCTTLPETNIFAPENRPKPKNKFHLPTIHFQMRTVSFRECISLIQIFLPIHHEKNP